MPNKTITPFNLTSSKPFFNHSLAKIEVSPQVARRGDTTTVMNMIDHTFGDKDLLQDENNITYTVSKLSDNYQHTLLEIKDALMINDEEEGFHTPLDGIDPPNNHEILNIQITGAAKRQSVDNINKIGGKRKGTAKKQSPQKGKTLEKV